MSLIVTQINRFGIVFVADSNVTTGDGSTVPGRKVIRIPHLGAALALAGSYRIGGDEWDRWMEGFIAEHAASQSPTLGSFAVRLAERLQINMTLKELKEYCFVQIAGYVKVDDDHHPEMWFVRNAEAILKDGSYSEPMGKFLCSEDFWSRDAKAIQRDRGTLWDLLQVNSSVYFAYGNGTREARIAYNILRGWIETAFWIPLWQTGEFRPPINLRESEVLAAAYHRIIDIAYQLSDYRTKWVGGTPQVESIAAPFPPIPDDLRKPA